MKQLHPVFNVVKLTSAPEDLITEWEIEDYPPPIVIEGEVEWEVEECQERVKQEQSNPE